MGWMSTDDMLALYQVAKLVPKDGIVVEVGSMFGKSAISWATHCEASKIYCIDTFYEKYIVTHGVADEVCIEMMYPLSGVEYNILEIFTENTRGFSNIIPIRGYSPNQITIEEAEIDLFFLDASHTNPNDWENIEYFLPKIKKGGIISGHDYILAQFPDVVDNVKRLERLLGTTVTLYQGSSVWSMIIK